MSLRVNLPVRCGLHEWAKSMKWRLVCLALILLVVSIGVPWCNYLLEGKHYRGKPVAYWKRAATIIDGCCINEPEWTVWQKASHRIGFSDPDKDRDAIIRAQTELFNGDPDGVPVLLELLKDDDVRVWLRAAGALHRLGYTKLVVAELIERMKFDDGTYLCSIAHQLLEIDPAVAADQGV